MLIGSETSIEQMLWMPNSLQLKKEQYHLPKKGSSFWLTVISLQEHGFFQNKGEFHDALYLRYGWDIKNAPKSCVYGSSFSIDHAMTCKRGGFVIVKHNELRDITAKLLIEMCHSVAVEPTLQPLTGEKFAHASAIVGEEASS